MLALASEESVGITSGATVARAVSGSYQSHPSVASDTWSRWSP